MNNIKWNLLFLAILATFSIVGIGIFLGARSSVGMIVCLIILVAVMGYGFKVKKKMLDAGKL
ncbi:YlaF family protein [Lederbergia citrea]|uniref:YlaF family protein n=1 Tax=Lederbergia citrea TaxID=2833581 RepID=A0A942Z1H1_9BACI|nr:YlaF family protein [Lederbergia citrea]MBS4177264.1 YlaF family protein [Lederbergia citrea]MBS4203927.1 YlaF family protein [Lederbergia citrea]MBS4221488.1 YlaF family protein [Lederbergia citrea]